MEAFKQQKGPVTPGLIKLLCVFDVYFKLPLVCGLVPTGKQ